MRARTVVLSVLFHAGLAASLLGVAAGRSAKHHPIAVALAESAKPKPKPKPLKTAPKPIARAPIEHKVAALPKASAPVPVAAAPVARVAVATAVAMSNDDDSPGGIALPTRAAPAPAPTRVASAVTESRKQRLREALGAGSGASEEPPCTEEPTKPEPVFKQEIEYTAQARAEGIEGKLKLRLTVGADGAVVKVDVVESVSPELDAAAVAAAKQWRFKPAMACGRAVAGGTYVLARRFELGD